jgi:hypothetical protein
MPALVALSSQLFFTRSHASGDVVRNSFPCEKRKPAASSSVTALAHGRTCVVLQLSLWCVWIDRSAHRWFEHRGPRCILLVHIDDATVPMEVWEL